jgi:hypothetical protein
MSRNRILIRNPTTAESAEGCHSRDKFQFHSPPQFCGVGGHSRRTWICIYPLDSLRSWKRVIVHGAREF